MKLKLTYKIKYRVILGKIAIVAYPIGTGKYVPAFTFVHNSAVYSSLDTQR